MTKAGKTVRKAVIIFLLITILTISFMCRCCGTVKNGYTIQLLSGREYFVFDRPDIRFGEPCILIANNVLVLGR